jgi:hypothetical protein
MKGKAYTLNSIKIQFLCKMYIHLQLDVHAYIHRKDMHVPT